MPLVFASLTALTCEALCSLKGGTFRCQTPERSYGYHLSPQTLTSMPSLIANMSPQTSRLVRLRAVAEFPNPSRHMYLTADIPWHLTISLAPFCGLLGRCFGGLRGSYSLLGLFLFSVDFYIVVEDNENHGGGAKENRKAVEIVVGNHDGLGIVCAAMLLGDVQGGSSGGLLRLDVSFPYQYCNRRKH